MSLTNPYTSPPWGRLGTTWFCGGGKGQPAGPPAPPPTAPVLVTVHRDRLRLCRWGQLAPSCCSTPSVTHAPTPANWGWGGGSREQSAAHTCVNTVCSAPGGGEYADVASDGISFSQWVHACVCVSTGPKLRQHGVVLKLMQQPPPLLVPSTQQEPYTLTLNPKP